MLDDKHLTSCVLRCLREQIHSAGEAQASDLQRATTSESQTVGEQSENKLLCVFLPVLSASFDTNKTLQRPLQSFHTVAMTFVMDPLMSCLQTNYFL